MKGTVMITGGAGFLGTYVAEACVAAGLKIIGLDRQLPARPGLWTNFYRGSVEAADLHGIAAAHELTACFHLAGKASVQRSMECPFDDFSSLLPGTVRILEFLGRAQTPCHFVLFSSAAVYGDPQSLPVTEEMAPRPISPYGAHKLAAEVLTASYAAIYGLRCSILRVFSAYGAGLKKQVFWDIMRKDEAARTNEDRAIELAGTGEETRDYIFAADVARAALLVAQQPMAGDPPIYNVANGEEVTLTKAVHALLDCANPVEARFTGESRKGDPSRWVADVRKLSALGFKPTVSLTEGLREYREWYLART